MFDEIKTWERYEIINELNKHSNWGNIFACLDPKYLENITVVELIEARKRLENAYKEAE